MIPKQFVTYKNGCNRLTLLKRTLETHRNELGLPSLRRLTQMLVVSWSGGKADFEVLGMTSEVNSTLLAKNLHELRCLIEPTIVDKHSWGESQNLQSVLWPPARHGGILLFLFVPGEVFDKKCLSVHTWPR